MCKMKAQRQSHLHLAHPSVLRRGSTTKSSSGLGSSHSASLPLLTGSHGMCGLDRHIQSVLGLLGRIDCQGTSQVSIFILFLCDCTRLLKTKDMTVLTHSLPSTLGPWSVVLYDSLARVSGRYSIICYNFLLITRLECLEHILTSSFVRKYLLDTSNIVNANVRLHSWNGIGLCVMTLLHVWSILFPCITHGYTAVVVPGVWEWPASERTPVKCSVSDEPGCWPGDANPGENTLYDCNENDLCLCIYTLTLSLYPSFSI